MLRLSCILFLSCSVFIQCTDNKKDIPDISGISINSKLIRYDQEFSQLDTSINEATLEKFWQKYQNFNEIYFKNILGLDITNRSQLLQQLKSMLSHPTHTYIRNVIDSIYPDNQAFVDLNASFKYLKYYIPEWEAPDIYTLSSEFGFANFLFDDNNKDGLGIGLDFFLGDAIPYKQIDPSNPAFSEYLVRTFNKEHLISKSMTAIIDDLLPPLRSNQILNMMIHNGKKLYLLSQVVPHASDSIIHEYSSNQMEWCIQNEYEIWTLLIEENILYSNDIRKYNKLVNPSPTSPGMPKESPGRTANFSGYKIVEAYMENTDSSVPEMLETDAKTILSKSKYKPRRK